MSKTLKTAIPLIILVVFAGTSIAPLLSVNSLNGATTDFENTILLQNTDGTNTGTATRYYKENIYNITLSADMDTPTEGNHYEGWIIRLNPFKTTSIGALSQNKEGKWIATYSEINPQTNYEEFSTLIITEEIGTGTPTIPSETHVLEGIF